MLMDKISDKRHHPKSSVATQDFQVFWNFNVLIILSNVIFSDLEFEHKDPDPGSFVTSEDEGLRLKWTAFLEFTQNQDVGEMTWDKVRNI